MRLPSSSTLRSDPVVRQRALVVVWTVLGLCAIDVCVNLAFGLPDDPRIRPSRLERYFDNGRSTEAKVRYLAGASEAESHPILKRGWLNPMRLVDEPSERKPDDRLLVAIYGMSHARLLLKALSRVADDVSVRDGSAPAATANWSYAAYQIDRPAHRADAAVIGILSKNIAMLTSLSALTATFDTAIPYAQPRFRLVDGALIETPPFFRTEREFREALADRTRWTAFERYLEEHDPYYHPFLFRASIVDRSATGRAVRRSMADRIRGRQRALVYDADGTYRNDSEAIQVLRAMIVAFAAAAREDGVVPVVFVANSLGYGDTLFQAISTTLEENSIPTLSSHEFVPPNEPSGYLPDGHFLPSHDDEMARALIALVERERAATRSRSAVSP